MFNPFNIDIIQTYILLFQLFTYITILIFLIFFTKANSIEYKIDIKSYYIKIIIVLLLWNLNALPVSIIFLIKLNILNQLFLKAWFFFLIIFISNTPLIYLYINFFINNNIALLVKQKKNIYSYKTNYLTLLYIGIITIYSPITLYMVLL